MAPIGNAAASHDRVSCESIGDESTATILWVSSHLRTHYRGLSSAPPGLSFRVQTRWSLRSHLSRYEEAEWPEMSSDCRVFDNVHARDSKFLALLFNHSVLCQGFAFDPPVNPSRRQVCLCGAFFSALVKLGKYFFVCSVMASVIRSLRRKVLGI